VKSNQSTNPAVQSFDNSPPPAGPVTPPPLGQLPLISESSQASVCSTGRSSHYVGCSFSPSFLCHWGHEKQYLGLLTRSPQYGICRRATTVLAGSRDGTADRGVSPCRSC